MDEQTNPRKHTAAKSKMKVAKPLIALAVVVAVAGMGFFGGVQYQKGRKNTATSNGQFQSFGDGSGNFGGQGGMRGGQMGEFGSVTAVSSTSISVKINRSGETKTYTINSSTTITKDSATASASDIAVGDTVIVQASDSDSTTATRIVINPSMNGGPQMESSGTTTQTN